MLSTVATGPTSFRLPLRHGRRMMDLRRHYPADLVAWMCQQRTLVLLRRSSSPQEELREPPICTMRSLGCHRNSRLLLMALPHRHSSSTSQSVSCSNNSSRLHAALQRFLKRVRPTATTEGSSNQMPTCQTWHFLQLRRSSSNSMPPTIPRHLSPLTSSKLRFRQHQAKEQGDSSSDWRGKCRSLRRKASQSSRLSKCDSSPSSSSSSSSDSLTSIHAARGMHRNATMTRDTLQMASAKGRGSTAIGRRRRGERSDAAAHHLPALPEALPQAPRRRRRWQKLRDVWREEIQPTRSFFRRGLSSKHRIS
mmetsp:Transcript_13766/g.32362  ORF Transcript_13766/g.32362 Transcript_13766/m.32362 type:complete len:308 (+) Transcript_13766:1194-2117(+)